VIRFTAPLQLWTGGLGSWHFLTVPDDFDGEIRAHSFGSGRGFRSVRVEVTIRAVTWQTSIFPMKAGGCFLPVKADVRRKADIAADDYVTVALELL
jgi:hypothetical protein